MIPKLPALSVLGFFAATGAVFGTGAASAAEPFVAIPPEQAAQYHLDFSRHYFSTPAAEVAARQALDARLKRLEALRGKVAGSPETLLQALHLEEQARVDFSRHLEYLHLRHAVDTRDAQSAADESALAAELAKRTSFLEDELMSLDAATFERFAAQEPALAPYRFAVEQARRRREHTRPVAEEELLSTIGPLAAEWPSDLYDTLLDHVPFGTVATPAGPLDVRRQRAAIAQNADLAVREAGFKQRYSALAAQQDLFAFTLLRLARSRNALARLHHFATAADEAYFGSFLTVPEVDRLLAALAERADVYKRYQQRRADAAKASLGGADPHPWDILPAATPSGPPRFPIAEARQILSKSLAPLGPHFSAALAQLLDPKNGRLDIVRDASGDHRASGGFSQGFIGVDSVFFASGYDGSYNDLRVLAHEATHAVHRQLMSQSGVSPLYADGPHFLFESFASFSEMLLADALEAAERDPARRRFFHEQFLDGKATVMFVAGPEAALEQAVYAGAQDGTLRGAAELDALTQKTFARYSIWPEREPALRSHWMAIPLMYEDPFYDLNYVYAGLLALEYSALQKQDPQGFATRYTALLEHGFDAPPAELLKRYLGIDLDDRKLVTDALRVLEAKMAEEP
jgi:oligoendopeptidase F